jgi:hypothetical protein
MGTDACHQHTGMEEGDTSVVGRRRHLSGWKETLEWLEEWDTSVVGRRRHLSGWKKETLEWLEEGDTSVSGRRRHFSGWKMETLRWLEQEDTSTDCGYLTTVLGVWCRSDVLTVLREWKLAAMVARKSNNCERVPAAVDQWWCHGHCKEISSLTDVNFLFLSTQHLVQ